MGRYKSYREPRRRGFDDDNYSPGDRDRNPGPSQFQRDSTNSSPSTDATLAWFNPDKGFGFVGIDGGGKDVFIHASVVAISDLTSLSEGDKLTVKFVAGNKGPQATSVRLRD